MEYFTIPSKPFFKVSIDGDILFTLNNKVCKPYYDKDGYARVAAQSHGKTYHVAVHRAVAEVFVVNPNPEEFDIVNHKNSIKNDNRVENLEWVNQALNRQHSHLSGNCHNNYKGEKHSQSVVNEQQVREICKHLISGLRICDVANMFGVSRHIVMNIKNGISWTHITCVEFPEMKVIPKRSGFSQSTAEWVKFNLDKGTTKEEILKQGKLLTKERLDSIISYIRECNDYSQEVASSEAKQYAPA